MHLVVLSQLALSPEGYDAFITFAHHPAVLAGELLVVLGALMHGLNGLRIVFCHFSPLIRYQKIIFWVLMTLAIGAGIYFGVRMYGA